MYRIIGTALSPDGESLHVSGDGPGGWRESQIATLDTRTLQVQSREFFADAEGYRRDRFGGLAITSSHELETSPDGSRIFIARAQSDDEAGWGVAVLDGRTVEAVGFVGPFPQGSMSLTVVPPGSFSPAGALAVTTGDPSGWPNVGPKIRLVDPITLEMIDSADVSSALADENDGITLMVPAPGGDALYLRSASSRLLKYDLIGRRVVAQARAPAPPCVRCLTVTPDGQRLYLAHTWTHDAPSSGIISVYDSDLNEQPPIDLSGVEVPHLNNSSSSSPPALNSVAVAPDGILLVATGAMLAQLWGFQSGRVFFVDPSSHEVLDTITMSGEVAALEILVRCGGLQPAR